MVKLPGPVKVYSVTSPYRWTVRPSSTMVHVQLTTPTLSLEPRPSKPLEGGTALMWVTLMNATGSVTSRTVTFRESVPKWPAPSMTARVTT